MKHISLAILFAVFAAAAFAQIQHIEDRGIVPGESNGLADTYDGIDVSIGLPSPETKTSNLPTSKPPKAPPTSTLVSRKTLPRHASMA